MKQLALIRHGQLAEETGCSHDDAQEISVSTARNSKNQLVIYSFEKPFFNL